MKLLPIEYDDWDDIEVGVFNFMNGRWVEDWGPFKAGTTFNCIVVNTQQCFVEEINAAGDKITAAYFRVVPLDPN